MGRKRTREPQYEVCLTLRDQGKVTHLGLMTNQMWREDPRRLGFVLARYKFVSKMLSGSRSVLEVGCGDAFGTRVVLQEVDRLTAVDFDPVFVKDAQERMEDRWRFTCRVHDMCKGPAGKGFDGAYALDVLEHIPKADENRFVGNIARSLKPHGVMILGTPSLQSQAYASAPSRAGHVNCKESVGLRRLVARHFHQVFLFSMNDEVVHTGFYPMANYFFALACGPRGRN